MLVERPFLKGHVCTQEGGYLRHQQLLEMQLPMGKLNQFPIENFGRYHQVQEDKVRSWQAVARFNAHINSISSEPSSYISPNLDFEGPGYQKNWNPKSPTHRKFPKVKQEVAAFGPQHAEHARRYYQTKRTQPIQEFRQIIIPPFRPNHGPVQVSGHRQTQVAERVYLLREPVFVTSLNQTALYTDSLKSQVPVPDTSPASENVLKIAKISTRPSKKQPTKTKASIGFGVKLLNHKVERGPAKNSDDCLDSACERDLSNAPVFQILCEVSNTL